MMRFASRTAVGLLVGVGLVGCGNMKEAPNGFLTPTQFFQNDAEIHAGLAGAWEPLIDYNLYKQPSWIGESFEDPYLNPANWLGGSGSYNGVTEGNWYTERPWTGDYQLIAGADQVLAAIPTCTGCTKANSKLYAGQAYFLRAWAYFDIAMRFGPAVIRNTPYTFSPNGGTIARSPLPVVYHQISADLHQAIDSLPAANYSESIGGSRPSAISAWGLLAKVYLFEAGHAFDDENSTAYVPNLTYMDSAAYAAQQVMNSGVASLEPNYFTLFDPVAQKSSPEILWTVDLSDAASGSGSEISDYFTPPDWQLGGGYGQGYIGLRRDFYNTFEPGDLRVAPNKGIFIHWIQSQTKGATTPPGILLDSLAAYETSLGVVKDSIYNYGAFHQNCRDFGANGHMLTLANGTMDSIYASDEIFITKYVDVNATSKLNNGNDIHLVRYAEVLLIYAEAENEIAGPTAAAYSALNQVRTRAGLPASTAAGQMAFRQAVWNERNHELFGEGMTKFDLIRQGRWLATIDGTSPLYPADGPCSTETKYNQLTPLPQSELSGNPAATQNPGW
jgi:starch-binding outer membrane protein, SusD/RagB family